MYGLEHSRERRILIVDDNRAIHEDFRKILGRDDAASELADMEASMFDETPVADKTPEYRIDDAYQGQEARDKVAEALKAAEPYDLAFVDMRMPPGWDGVETIERIWQEDPDVQIVICTAFSDYSWPDLFARFGGSDNLLLLKKPFDNSEVQQLAAALTEKRRLAERARLRMDELEKMVEERTAELRDKEEQLRHKQKLEAIGSLAGGVAHEFNNLLQIIQEYTKFAMEELPPNGEPYNDLEQVLGATERAAAIAGQLLSFSRRQPSQRTNVDLAELASNAAAMLRPLLGEHIQLRVSTDDAPVPILGDQGMLEQALINLCTNARDAMPSAGQIQIATTTVMLSDRRDQKNLRPSLKPGPYAVLTVADTGSGIPPDVRERIFDPFFTTKEVGKGTGLGLAMVYGTVQQHDGAILVESEPGKGTTFEIYLPIVESAARIAAEHPKKEARGGSETILIAEDEEVVRDVAIRILQKAGYSTVSAKNGEEAVRVLMERKEEISLALLDVVMPKMSGHEVYRYIRRECPHLKVVFCTGYDPAAHQVAFLKEEANARLIEKPFPAGVLLRTVREQLDDSHSPALLMPAARHHARCVACEA